MACMDDVPEFVVHYEIKSYLDFEDKINLNRALKPMHRMSKKIPIKNIINHQFCIITRDLRLMLAKQKESAESEINNRNDSAKRIEKIFKYCIKPMVLDFISSFSGFKAAILERITKFKNSDDIEFQRVDIEHKKSLIYYAKVLEIKIHKNNCTKYLKYFQEDNSIRSPTSYLLS
jgi:hypothetical protein